MYSLLEEISMYSLKKRSVYILPPREDQYILIQGGYQYIYFIQEKISIYPIPRYHNISGKKGIHVLTLN